MWNERLTVIQTFTGNNREHWANGRWDNYTIKLLPTIFRGVSHLVRKRRNDMKKEITLVLKVDTDDDNEEITKDLEREISCCSNQYDIENITIK